MQYLSIKMFGLVGIALASIVSISIAEEIDDAFFQQRILPVLQSHCYQCHSAKTGKSKGGLQLDSANRMKLGGDSGAVLAPGDLNASLLYQAISHTKPDLQMPPKSKLPDDVIADFAKWIRSGAKDDRKSEPIHDAAFIARSQADTDRSAQQQHSSQLWSLKSPQKVDPAPAKNADWARSTVDRYVIAQMEQRGTTPVADADRRALIRRVYFDLIGLPPSPKTVEAFVVDRAPDAFAKIVDSLLSSEHFGERWGRHWLDVARYAESNGGDANVTYPHAWRYRDYVIRSFNADKPYNRFIEEQIAGDLLEADSDEQRSENLVATGFLAIGPKNLNERNYTQFKLDLVDEQIDVVTRAFLGITVACARCHDHKTDPITSREYYALAGMFLSTNTEYGTLRETDFNINSDGLISIQVADKTKTEGRLTEEQRASVLSQMEDTRRQLASLRGGRPGSNNGNAAGMDAVQVRRTSLQLGMTLDRLEAKLYDFDQAGNALTHAMGVMESKLANSPLYERGEASNPGEIVPRGFVRALAGGLDLTIPSNRCGRQELALSITAVENPLTARVMVNRIWSHLFGKGLVTSMDDFGTMGQPPSHPELLDHLAIEFRGSGWSIKNMIRSLLMTRTYQLSSDIQTTNYENDPDNVTLWHASKRRLEAEILRDSVLYLAGWLDERPLRSQTFDIGNTPLGGRRGYRLDDFNFNVRYRSVYLPILRENVPDCLSLFDFAEPNMIVGQRSDTVVPAQALYLMNSDFIQKNSDRFGEWLMRAASDDTDRVRLAYQWLLTRPPNAHELTNALDFIDRYSNLMHNESKAATEAERASFAALVQSLFGCAEFRYLN